MWKVSVTSASSSVFFFRSFSQVSATGCCCCCCAAAFFSFLICSPTPDWSVCFPSSSSSCHHFYMLYPW